MLQRRATAYDTYANVTYQAFTWQNRYSDANTVVRL